MYLSHSQHIVGHHLYTNIDGHDPDIMTSITDGPDFRRIKINQKWLPYYLYQHLYCPLLYCLVRKIIQLQMLPYILLLIAVGGKISIAGFFSFVQHEKW